MLSIKICRPHHSDAQLDVLIARQARRFQIDGARGIGPHRERIEQHALLVGTAQLPPSQRYQHDDQHRREQRHERPRRKDPGTDFDGHDILPGPYNIERRL